VPRGGERRRAGPWEGGIRQRQGAAGTRERGSFLFAGGRIRGGKKVMIRVPHNKIDKESEGGEGLGRGGGRQKKGKTAGPKHPPVWKRRQSFKKKGGRKISEIEQKNVYTEKKGCWPREEVSFGKGGGTPGGKKERGKINGGV